MRTSIVLLSLTASLTASLALASCASRKGIANQGATVVSSSTVYLRNTFDTDPSTYIGRFVPPGVTDIDESNTLTLACSKHITARFVDGGGVAFSEDLSVSTAVAAKIGIPVIADASASHSMRRSARADYTLTGKMVAEIKDPEAFAACCKTQPDQCTDRFIGEFVQGVGSLNHNAARDTEVAASGTNPQSGISGSGSLDASAAWKRVAEFPNPVYFAFKLNPTAYSQAAVNRCPSWVDKVPSEAGGIYVVGRADDERSEAQAREAAMADADAIALQSAGLGRWSLGGAKVAIQAEEWCMSSRQAKRKTRHSARVLAWVSDESIAAAKARAEQVAAQAREDQAREDQAEAGQGSATASPTSPEPAATEPAATTDASAGSSDLTRIAAAVEAESFSSDKLAALEFSGKSARLSAAEGRKVLDLFTTGDDKLKALTFLQDKISDPQNWQILVDGFASSFDRDKARKLAP